MKTEEGVTPSPIKKKKSQGILNETSSQDDQSSVSSSPRLVTPSPSPAPALSSTANLELDSLPQGRKKMINLLISSIEHDAPTEAFSHEVVVSVARGIEMTLNNLHSYTSDTQNYQTKIKKLTFNLKKNKVFPPSLLG